MAVPNRKDVVLAVAQTHTFDGSKANALDFCRKVVRQLRKDDKRWGLNYKRGKVGDPSADIVAYQDPTEGTRIVDIIAAYDVPAEWGGPQPKVGWHLHTIEAAGKVMWFWDEFDGVEPPVVLPPTPYIPPPPSVECKFQKTVCECKHQPVDLTDLVNRLKDLQHDVDIIMEKLDRSYSGSARFIGNVTLTPKD